MHAHLTLSYGHDVIISLYQLSIKTILLKKKTSAVQHTTSLKCAQVMTDDKYAHTYDTEHQPSISANID